MYFITHPTTQKAFLLFGYPRPLIAVTGTVGKTTTKDLLAAMLAKKYKTACSPGNMNTTSGLVYSMSLTEGDEEIAVVELGAGKGTDMGIFSRNGQAYS